MSRKFKLILYAVCIVAVVILGSITVRSYHEATKASERRAATLARVTAEETNATEIPNVAEITNLTAEAAVTNTAPTNAGAAKRDQPADTAQVAGVSSRGYTRMVTYGLALLVFFLVLASLIAYDVSQFFGSRAEKALFNDDGAPVDPEYEEAEELWKDGKHLECVNAMRDYLNKHPREQYVALRIAEIYEENLNNPLAAALEYEEVLKKNLPPERWGWAAIHLANLYSGKLNQPDKAVALLHRIDAEYGRTTAANKARERLVQIDPNFVPAAVPEVLAAQETEAGPAPSNLPPGFRPKI